MSINKWSVRLETLNSIGNNIRWPFVQLSPLTHSTNFTSTLEKRACENEQEERKKKKRIKKLYPLPPTELLGLGSVNSPWFLCSYAPLTIWSKNGIMKISEVTLKTSRHRDVPAKRRSHNHPPKLFVVLGTKVKLPYGLPQFTAMKSGCFPRSFSWN